jgi:hypothetical protein
MESREIEGRYLQKVKKLNKLRIKEERERK